MTLLRLVRRNLFSHWVRTTLTVLSIALAVFILCILRSLNVALTAGVEAAAANRLIAQSEVSLFVDLPQSYQAKIDQVEGISEVCKFQWFGGYYQDPEQMFPQFGVDPEIFMRMYSEVVIKETLSPEGAPPEAAFFADRRACLIGQGLAQRFGWKLGQTVPVIGALFPTVDRKPWEFLVAGIYKPASPNVDSSTLFFHYEYLDEALRSGAAEGPPGVGVYVLGVERGADPVRIMGDVEALFENGPQVVQCTTEKEFQRQFVGMLGNVPTLLSSIGGGIVFAIALAVLNTMLMAGRERTRDFGILKALGFTDRTTFLVLAAEAVLLCLVGGLLGLFLAWGSQPALQLVLGAYFPGYRVSGDTMIYGVIGSLLLGLLAALVPGTRAARLRPVAALRAEG